MAALSCLKDRGDERMAKKKKRKREAWQKQFTYEVAGLALLAISVIALSELGVAGRAVKQMALLLTGEWYAVLLFAFIVISIYFMWKRSMPSFLTRKWIGGYMMYFSILMFSHVQLFRLLSNDGRWQDTSVIRNTWQLFLLKVSGEAPQTDLGGGMIGAVGFAFFYLLFEEEGAMFLSFLLIVVAILLITGRSPVRAVIRVVQQFFSFTAQTFLEAKNEFQSWRKAQKEKRAEQKNRARTKQQQPEREEEMVQADQRVEPIIEDFTEKNEQLSFAGMEEDWHDEPNDQTEKETVDKPMFAVGEVANEEYELPPTGLLNRPQKTVYSHERGHISQNARKLEHTFESFGVKAKVLKVHLGPAVTKYEVHPAIGVKVSKIVNLSDDLALALAAKDIRIEAPIPGKSAIGIEVPNQEVALVSLREVIESRNYQDHPSKLSIALGRDISGEPVVADLTKMPHLLVAGATGSGKSVCINSMITSLLMRAKPHEVKLMMIDPKMVELNVYNGIPHLLTPVVTDPKKASQALKKVVDEMERRYELFSHSGTRNIEGYNEWIRRHQNAQPNLPYIVVIVDELADLMMVASRDVEESITRLAQMARAAGIHLIIATQRPSVDVITGVIKANIPSRIAFSVSSQTDSRTILDTGGAEKLLGQGDMLFLPSGASKPTRIQGAFLSDDEVEKIVRFVISQQKAAYQKELMPEDDDEPHAEEVDDELYHEAVRLVIERQTASVSMLQRRFRIGYTRAARLIDEMEARGVVGPYEGSKPRAVLISHNDEASSG